jgi:hypothetical protein
MRLYVCHGMFLTPRPGGDPCANAPSALAEAGHGPEVVRTYGLGRFPNVVDGSQEIAMWAQAHPVA